MVIDGKLSSVCLIGITIVPRLPVLHQAPIVSFFGVGSIDEELSSQTKKRSVSIVRVDVFMKKHFVVPVATNVWFVATTTAAKNFWRLKCDLLSAYYLL